MEPNNLRLAVLIDAENVQPVHADLIFSSAQAMGAVVAREIYGAASALTTWVEPVLKYAIHPNLTIRAAKGKNSSDIALVIGAMDLALSGSIDGMVIASSDSDFSALSVRLRTAGLQVIGMGTEKANALWRKACGEFVVLEAPSQKAAAKQPPAQPAQPAEGARKSAQAKGGKAAPAASHAERAAAIEQVIRKRLDANGGRLQVSTLFPVLNRLSEYRVDRQGAGKRPLNYLTSTFGEVFDFENADGNVWITTKGCRDENAAAPEAEPLTEAAGAEDDVDPDEAALATRMLIEGGMAADVAENIVGILQAAADKRAAYNGIRRIYGSIDGRRYYNQAKDILENRES